MIETGSWVGRPRFLEEWVVRHTGIPLIGDVPWGTHFCQFYEGPRDLIEILVPYFKAGLENNEFCMWITSEPLGVDEARAALAREVAGLDEYFRRGQIEILDYSQWYTIGGRFDSARVLDGWIARLESARRRGLDGLRLTGNTFWLEKADWRDFTEYEATVDSIIGRYPMLAICTYSLAKCGAIEIMDVVSNHAFALVQRAGGWQLIESLERNRIEGTLRHTSEQRRVALEAAGLGAWDYRFDTGEVFWDERCRDMFGVSSGSQLDYSDAMARIHAEDRPATDEAVKQALAGAGGGAYHREFRIVWPDGSVHWVASHGRVYFEGEGDERHAVRFIGVNMDITERKRAEEAQRLQREWLRVTLASIGDAVIATDTAGRITFVNPVAAGLSGWTEVEALGRPVQDVLRLVNHETGEEAAGVVKRVLVEGCAILLGNHTFLVTREGREIPIEDSAAPIRDAAGKVTGAVLVFHDVTEKYRAQEALRESEQRVRLKLESILSPEGDIGNLELGDIIDAQSIQSLMDDFYRIARLPMAIIDLQGKVLVGVGWQDICTRYHRVHPDTCRNCIESDTQLSSSVAPGEFRLYKCKNHMWDVATPLVIGGRKAGNLFSGQFFFDDEPVDTALFRSQAQKYGFNESEYLAALDDVPRVSREAVNSGMAYLARLGEVLSRLSYSNLKLARSLSERDALMASLLESEKRERARAAELEAIMDAVPFATFIARDPECLSLAGNRMTYELLRVPPGSEFSQTADDNKTPNHYRMMKDGVEIAPENFAARTAACTGRPVENYEYDIVYDDGACRHMLGNAVPLLDENGRPRGAVAGFLDVTERKRMEERLREAQKLECIGLLAGGIAHDFNNLLVGIVGNASLAEDLLPNGSPAAEFLKGIVTSGEHAAHLTRQMLAYAGKGQFLIESVNLSAVVRETISLIQSTISGKIRVHLQLDENLPSVESDPSQIQQVFMNLVLNAAEAVGDRAGVVAVTTGMVTVDAAYARNAMAGWSLQPGPHVFLEVRDTGCGMDAGTKAKIFDPFFTTKFQGRGLGLAAVAGIVRAHKGAIGVATAPGAGTTFRILLPVAAAGVAASAPPARREDEPHGQGTILVVDDEPMVCDLARRALERRGYHVLVASSGAEAIDLVRSHGDRIRLAILDQAMPGMSGEDTLPEMRKLQPDLNVVVSSGYSETQALRVFRGVRLSGFLQKPYTVQDLNRRVAAALK